MTVPNLQKRRGSLRLRGFDYSSEGSYFVTVCVSNRRHLFGTVTAGKLTLNKAGHAVRDSWLEIPKRFESFDIDSFIVMPDHIHGIVFLKNLLFVGASLAAPENEEGGASPSPTKERRPLGNMVGAFKSLSARSVNRLLGQGGQLWQRGYYDHIIRSENEMKYFREYIEQNPLRWTLKHSKWSAL